MICIGKTTLQVPPGRDPIVVGKKGLFSLAIVTTFNSFTSRPNAGVCLVVQTLMGNISMTPEACESKLRSVVRSSMHPCPGNWVAIGRAVEYYALATHAFSAGMKCRHCTLHMFHTCRITSVVESPEKAFSMSKGFIIIFTHHY